MPYSPGYIGEIPDPELFDVVNMSESNRLQFQEW